MPPLPVISGKRTVAALERAGFAQTRQRGSHVFVIHPKEPHRRTTVPLHSELDRGTLRAILRQADISIDRFNELLEG